MSCRLVGNVASDVWGRGRERRGARSTVPHPGQDSSNPAGATKRMEQRGQYRCSSSGSTTYGSLRTMPRSRTLRLLNFAEDSAITVTAISLAGTRRAATRVRSGRLFKRVRFGARECLLSLVARKQDEHDNQYDARVRPDGLVHTRGEPAAELEE